MDDDDARGRRSVPTRRPYTRARARRDKTATDRPTARRGSTADVARGAAARRSDRRASTPTRASAIRATRAIGATRRDEDARARDAIGRVLD
jgi:hypothetical protein